MLPGILCDYIAHAVVVEVIRMRLQQQSSRGGNHCLHVSTGQAFGTYRIQMESVVLEFRRDPIPGLLT